jgi:hypothetical protein
MKRNFFISFVLLFSFCAFSQKAEYTPYKDGEWLEYKMSYSGFLRAGTATLELKETELDGKKVFYARGFGKTSSVIGWFFKVRDTYESYFGVEDSKPYLFKRDVYEGGHTIKRDTKFDYVKNLATVEDYKHKTIKDVKIGDVQDMISSFYFLRKTNTDSLIEGQEIDLDMFFDSKTFPFKLKFLGRETIRTKFGKINTLKFRPLVQSGRVFKESESVTIWVTADDNKVPIKLKASLAVGSLRAELKAFKGLANSFEIVFD